MELEQYKHLLKTAINNRISSLQSDTKNNGFTGEQNYTLYAVISELQMILELIDSTVVEEVCSTCGKSRSGSNYCSNSFHIWSPPITESYDSNMFGSKYREESKNWDDPAIGHFKD